MGNLCSRGLSERDKRAIFESNQFDRALKNHADSETKVTKLLLLGTGESGKSTIFKQMQILYEEGFSELEKATFRSVLRHNVVDSMRTLIKGCEKFGLQFTKPAAAAAQVLTSVDPLVPDFFNESLIPPILLLWHEEPAIRQAYDKRAQLQLLDSAEYLFTHIKRIGSPNFVPNSEDILRARLRTSGIVERSFHIQGLEFKFLDVGGQRNERRKWIHCFDNVTAVFYIAAINEYDQRLFEDEKQNRLQESLDVFDTTCNSHHFKNASIILFLNKIDLFQEKLSTSRVADHFPDYKGDNSYDSASQFIRDKFLSRNTSGKQIFCHLTCATDTKNVQRVFEACKKTILKNNLDELQIA